MQIKDISLAQFEAMIDCYHQKLLDEHLEGQEYREELEEQKENREYQEEWDV